VKKPSPPTSSEHPDSLLLPYVEDMISAAEKADVEEHLSTCDQCALRAEELREAIDALKQNKQAFCPEPWELYDFAHRGDDPHGVVSLHIENCPLCSDNLRAWKTARPEEQMPAELWSRLRERLPRPAQKPILSRRPKWRQIVSENLARFWKAPALAAGVALAMLLMIVIFYQSPMEPIVPIPKSLPQKTAFLVLLRDFKDPLLQKQIESVSEALSASSELKDRYTIVSLAETSEVIKSGKVPSHDGSAMIDGLRRNLNVSRVLVVTVFPSADRLTARIEFIDTITGKTLQTKTEEKIEQSELPMRIRSDALGMLLSPAHQR
jgi:hypothetical protein